MVGTIEQIVNFFVASVAAMHPDARVKYQAQCRRAMDAAAVARGGKATEKPPTPEKWIN